ncbi:MAG: hypothetical protein KJI71_05620 [Patescibacteria group bacterium]|nr:hypothetical protein [Patescibacteria group bacterium]
MKWEDTLNILIELLKLNSGVKAARIENIFLSRTIENLKKVNMFVVLSYFNRKVGPLEFYSYPKNSLDRNLSVKIANIMDQQFNEGFFQHSFENLKSMNYFFEIPSDWARGEKEMLMVSIILFHQISPEIEVSIESLCKKFAVMMLSNEDIYTGFYINELSTYNEEDQNRIKKNEQLIKDEIRELYWETMEETREAKEEKLTQLENDRYIFESLEDLQDSEKDIFKVYKVEEFGILKSMRIDPETAVSDIIHSNPNIIAAAVIKGTQIIYSTDNWDISGDVDRYLSNWVGQNAQDIMISGVKYSILHMEV